MRRLLGGASVLLVFVMLSAFSTGCSTQAADAESSPSTSEESVEATDAASASSPEDESASSVDADIEQMVLDYLTGDDTSQAACDAAECSLARGLLDSHLERLPDSGEGLVGADIDAIYAALEEQYPNAPEGFVESLFGCCPCGGAIGARFYPAHTMNNGKVLWAAEVSCETHSPEAYARFLEQLAD